MRQGGYKLNDEYKQRFNYDQNTTPYSSVTSAEYVQSDRQVYGRRNRQHQRGSRFGGEFDQEPNTYSTETSTFS